MPEGHVVHRQARALTEMFAGKQVAAESPQGRFSAGAARIDGTVAGTAQAVGKHLFMPFDGESLWLHVHLGLYGRWHFGTPRGIPPTATSRLRLAAGDQLADLRGAAACGALSPVEADLVLERLGPDPIRKDPGDRKRFIDAVRRRRAPVGQLVMDQSVVAGPGNIYRAECLFRVGIHPYRPGSKVSAARLGLLWDDLAAAMADGLRDGAIITVPPELAPAEPMDGDEEASRFAVYHRTGRPCLRCGAPVREAIMQARRLFWCGTCQR